MERHTAEELTLNKQIDAIESSISDLCKDADTRDKIRTLRLFQQNINSMMFSMLSRAELDVDMHESAQNDKIQKKYEALKAIFND